MLKFILRLFEVVETFTRIHLVMEYAPGGELFNRVTSDGRLNEPLAACIFAQVLSAVSYMVRKLSIYSLTLKRQARFLYHCINII